MKVGRPFGWQITLGTALLGALAVGTYSNVNVLRAAPPVITEEVTYAKDIAPILQRSCENCHRAGGAGPMPLTSYEEVRPWARSIKTRVSNRQMPPWGIDKNVGTQQFKNDISLSDAEIAKVSSWVDAGAPLEIGRAHV